MKQTRQKTLILNQVSNRNDHPTVEMIHKELLLIDPHISLATVYRNLNTFALKGKIKKIEIPNAKDRFEWNLSRHDHAICFKCGKVIDIEPQTKKHHIIDGFKVHEVEVLYKGVCKECQNKGTKS